MVLIKLLLLGLTVASLGYYTFCAVAARRFFAHVPLSGKSGGDGLPPVSVLIPLRGIDFEAYENYTSFCRQNYPAFQIVFGVQDPGDSSVQVIRKLISDHPTRDIELVIGSETIGCNPKVNNLCNMLRRARYAHLVIADSDVRVRPDFLSSLVPHLLEERVGLVTCFYRAGKAPGFAAKLEALGISAEFAPGVLLAQAKEGMTFSLGAVMATSRSKLQAIGGFQAIADYIADDYMLGHLIWKAGYEVRLLPYVVETMLEPAAFTGMLRHQIRWGRTIRASRPAGYLGMVFTHGSVLALANALAHQASCPAVVLFASVLIVRMAVAWFIGVRCLGDEIVRKNLHLIFLRDLLSFFVWCASLAGRRVEWRGKTYRIVEKGRIVPLE